MKYWTVVQMGDNQLVRKHLSVNHSAVKLHHEVAHHRSGRHHNAAVCYSDEKREANMTTLVTDEQLQDLFESFGNAIKGRDMDIYELNRRGYMGPVRTPNEGAGTSFLKQRVQRVQQFGSAAKKSWIPKRKAAPLRCSRIVWRSYVRKCRMRRWHSSIWGTGTGNG